MEEDDDENDVATKEEVDDEADATRTTKDVKAEDLDYHRYLHRRRRHRRRPPPYD